MTFWKLLGIQKKRIYADAAAATPLSERARFELVRLLSLFGNAGALHTEGVEAKKELEIARKKIALAIGAHDDEIIFTASGTEANNLAIHGVIRKIMRPASQNIPFRRDEREPYSSTERFVSQGLHAITCAVEHQSVLEPLRALKREGLEVTELEVNSEGLVDPKKLAEAIKENTVFVSIQLVNSEVGTIEPVREIAKLLRKNKTKIYLHTDASQAPLWVKVGVEQLGVDLMTLDAQKVLGPKGVGALFVRRGTPIEPILWGGSQEHGLRGGTPNTPLAGSFAVSLADAQIAWEARAANMTKVRDHCFNEIKKLLPDAILNGPTGEARVANNINVSVPGLEAQMAVIALDVEGIAASTRSACNIGDEEPSHVIKALGVAPELAGTAIRITLLPDASLADAKRIAEALFTVAKRYRQNTV